MKRILLGLALLLGFAGAAQAQVTNPLISAFRLGTGGSCSTTACTSATKQLCRNSVTDPTAYACNTSTGFYEGSFTIASGSRLNLEGPAGDTYLIYTVATASLDAYVDGALGWSFIGGMLQAGPCPADLSGAPPGWCYDAETGQHVIVGGWRTYP